MQMKLSGLTVDQHGQHFTVYDQADTQLLQLLLPADGESLADIEALRVICKIIARRYKVNNKTG